MSADLEHYMRAHNDLVTQIELEPPGDVKAHLKRIADKMRSELLLAANMEDEGNVATKVYDRIDKLFNRM
jgi:hypothetical protein